MPIPFVDNNYINDNYILENPTGPEALLSNSFLCSENSKEYHVISSPDHVLMNVENQEINLKEAWDILELQKRIVFRCFKGNKSKPETKYCDIDSISSVLNYYSTILWVPHTFKVIRPANISNLVKLHTIVVDLDSKCCSKFWVILTDLFNAWERNELVDGMPKPSLAIFSGNGVHLYWNLSDKVMGDLRKELCKFIQQLFWNLLCKRFNSEFDIISIIQAMRLPGSYTKSGALCRAFKLGDETQDNKLLKLISNCLNKDQMRIIDDFLFSEAAKEDLDNLYKKLTEEATDKQDLTNKTKKICQSVYQDMNMFDGNTIGFISKIIDNSVIHNKDFAKKLVFIIKGQAPVSVGCRDHRLFGLSVGLAKCGADFETIKTLVRICNQSFLGNPLTSTQLYWCYGNASTYLQMSQRKLMSLLGIRWWPSFYKSEHKMTRKEAANNASSIQQNRSIDKVKTALVGLNTVIKVVDLCKKAGISRNTYYRLKNAGIIDNLIENNSII